MTTVFSAQKALDNIQFYIDPRSVESPACDRAKAVAHPVSNVPRSDAILASAQGDLVARNFHPRTNTAEALSMGCGTSHSCVGIPSPTVASPETECWRAPLARTNAGSMSSPKHPPSDSIPLLETNGQDLPVVGPGSTGAHQGPNCNEEGDTTGAAPCRTRVAGELQRWVSQAHTIESGPRREEFESPTPAQRRPVEFAAIRDHDRPWPDGSDNWDDVSTTASSIGLPTSLLCCSIEDGVAANTRERGLTAVDHDNQTARRTSGCDTTSHAQEASVGVHPRKCCQQSDLSSISVPQASNVNSVDSAGQDPDDESSGSDIVRLSRRRNPKPRDACSYTPPNALTESSRTTLGSGNHRRLRQGLRRAAHRPSPPTASVVIPATEREAAMRSFNTGTHQSTTGCVLQDPIKARIKIILELPSIASRRNVGLATLTLVPSSSTVPRESIRYTDEENKLLAKLKRQSRPKLSWRSIQAHFPNRTINALQVHYHMHSKALQPGRNETL